MKRSDLLSNIAYVIKDSEDLSDFEKAEAIVELQEELGLLEELE